MKISTINNYKMSNNSFVKNKHISYNQTLTSTPIKDSFVKNNVSFKANDNNNDDFWAAIILGGLFTTGFLIPTILVNSGKMPSDPNYIFLSDGTCLGKISEFGVDKEAAKEAGIDLSKDRFTVADPINGVFENPEKGININLEEGKYVDPENGIFIDKEAGISALYKNGNFEPIAIPNINFQGAWNPAMQNGGYGQTYYPPEPRTREGFIEKYGETPEEHYDGNVHKGPEVGYYPIERRNIFQKISDWFKDRNMRDYGTYDHWGREVVTVKDAMGTAHKVPLSDELSNIIHDRHMSYEEVQKFITYNAENPIVGYIAKNSPTAFTYMNFDRKLMSEFIADAQNADVAEIIKENDPNFTSQRYDDGTETPTNIPTTNIVTPEVEDVDIDDNGNIEIDDPNIEIMI